MIKCPIDVDKFHISQGFGKPASKTTAEWYKQLGLVNDKGEPWHNGTDFGCPKGTPLLAPIDGEITTQVNSDGCKMIWIKGRDLWVMMCHLDAFEKMTGDKVKAGELVGLSGNTGKYTTGAHLHLSIYEVKDGSILNFNNGVHGAVDPVKYLVEPIASGMLIKNKMEPSVFVIKNQYRWWLYDESTFEKFTGKKVSEAEIKIVDILTFNSCPYGGIIGKK